MKMTFFLIRESFLVLDDLGMRWMTTNDWDEANLIPAESHHFWVIFSFRTHSGMNEMKMIGMTLTSFQRDRNELENWGNDAMLSVLFFYITSTRYQIQSNPVRKEKLGHVNKSTGNTPVPASQCSLIQETGRCLLIWGMLQCKIHVWNGWVFILI